MAAIMSDWDESVRHDATRPVHGKLAGLVDGDGDGSPEVATTAFPNDTIVSGHDGAELTRSSIANCDRDC